MKMVDFVMVDCACGNVDVVGSFQSVCHECKRRRFSELTGEKNEVWNF